MQRRKILLSELKAIVEEVVEESLKELVTKGKTFDRYSFRQYTGNNDGNIHLFRASYNEENDECYVDEKSICSHKKGNRKINRENTTSFGGRDFRCLKEKDARLKAAALQNSGYKVCGTCISSLYADDEG